MVLLVMNNVTNVLYHSQQTYEEMFMKINPLEAAAASKNKSKDIHLPSIDVSFGSNRILCAWFSVCMSSR